MATRPYPPGLVAFAERVRPIAARIALAVVIVEALVWLSSWIPGVPLAGWWPAVVIPGFVLIFPLHLMTILRSGQLLGPPTGAWWRRRRGNPFGLLRGWRRGVPVAVFGLIALSLALNPSPGQPTERDGRYFANNHGDEEELTREEYEEAEGGWMRTFSAASLGFAALAYAVASAPTPTDR
jgi:hypothetical protein